MRVLYTTYSLIAADFVVFSNMTKLQSHLVTLFKYLQPERTDVTWFTQNYQVLSDINE